MCSRKWSLLNSMEFILCKLSLFMISRRMLSLVLVFFLYIKKLLDGEIYCQTNVTIFFLYGTSEFWLFNCLVHQFNIFFSFYTTRNYYNNKYTFHTYNLLCFLYPQFIALKFHLVYFFNRRKFNIYLLQTLVNRI